MKTRGLIDFSKKNIKKGVFFLYVYVMTMKIVQILFSCVWVTAYMYDILYLPNYSSETKKNVSLKRCILHLL